MIMNAWPKNPLNTITMNHVTAFPDPSSHDDHYGELSQNARHVWIRLHQQSDGHRPIPGLECLEGSTSCAFEDVPITSITKCFTSYTFGNNGLITPPPEFPPSKWPSNNMFPQTINDVEFINYNNGNGGNYELLSSSPYKNKGTDGKDLGADIVGLNQAWQMSNSSLT